MDRSPHRAERNMIMNMNMADIIITYALTHSEIGSKAQVAPYFIKV